MKRKLLKLFVPNSIQNRLSLMYVNESQYQDYLKRKEFEESLPVVDLSSGYIKYLRVVADIDELINRMPKNATVIEIGSGNGGVSFKILAITKPKKLYLIDTWSGTEPGSIDVEIIKNKFGAEVRSGQVEIRQGGINSEMGKIYDMSLDWVYLSTDNTYENTASLLKVSHEKVKKGGIIAGSNYGIGDWLTIQRYGVIEAVNEFCKKNGWEIIYLTHERDRNLSYALKEISSDSRLVI